MSALTDHGGNVEAARRAFPGASDPWIDLSTGINGQPYPIDILDPAVYARLPEPEALSRLEAMAARAYGVSADARVVAAPGTQALLQWLPQLYPAKRVGVLGFTYSEHERTWRASGAAMTTVAAIADLRGFDVAVIVNPNNPDGRLVSPADLCAVAQRNGLLVADEAFMDVLPDGAGLLQRGCPANAIVLRSFGKFFGLAGLRLGFAIAAPPHAERMRAALGPWAVSGEAIAIGSRALADATWKVAATSRLIREAERLDALATRASLTLVGGTPLFRLFRAVDGRGVFARLARRGILVRPYADHPDLLRFGIPAAPTQWRRLAQALAPAANGASALCERVD